MPYACLAQQTKSRALIVTQLGVHLTLGAYAGLFFVTVIKYYNQGNLKKRFFGLTVREVAVRMVGVGLAAGD